MHPIDEGSQARAEQYAAAAAACSPIDPDAPTAAKQVLPTSAFYGGSGSTPGTTGGTSTGGGYTPGADPVGDVDTEPVALAHGETHEASQDDAEGDAVTRPHDEREPGPDRQNPRRRVRPPAHRHRSRRPPEPVAIWVT